MKTMQMNNRAGVSCLRLALRNLGRHKAKTLITASVVSLTAFLFVTLDSYILGSTQDVERYMLLYESGAAKIYSRAYYAIKEDEPLYEGFQYDENLIKDIEGLGYHAAPRARFSGTLAGKSEEMPITILAVDPGRERKVLYNHKFLKRGEFVQNGKLDIVIGQKLAHDLGKDVGDVVRFSTQIEIKEPDGTVRRIDHLIDFRIGGIINTPNVKVNTEMGFTALDAMRDERGMMLYGRITEICLRDNRATERDLVLDTEETAHLRGRLGGILPGSLVIAGWQEEAKDYIALAEVMKMAMWVTLPIFLILGLLGISNTVSIAVKQRNREIGMLRSMGMYDAEIVRLFIYESALIGVIGTLVGLALGLAAAFYMVYVGIDITSSLEQANADYVARKAYIIRSAWNLKTYLGVSIIIPVFCALSALLPSRKAVKTEITRALRMDPS